MNRKKLVVIGNGMAGVKCVEEICNLAPDRFQITIFGSEPRPNYNRIMLSKVLQGDSAIDEITINDYAWYEDRGIRLFTGETVVRIQKEAGYVETQSGLRADYDYLIIATGSSAFIPPIAGINKPGVIAFRNIDDCNTMITYAKKYRKAAVIGGGLLGLEAARGLLNLGMETDVVHNAPYLMNRQLDRMSAELLRKELEGQGMRFWLSKDTESITGLTRAKGIRFSNGAALEADLIVVSVGIRPNIELARGSGIDTNRAIVVDDYMRTSVPNIFAVGECAEHRGIAYGLVAPLYEQGKVLAKTLCEEETAPYTGSVPYAQLKVSGVEVFSVGEINENDADTALQTYDGIRGTYKKVTMKNGIVSGAILFGDTTEGTSLLNLVKRQAPISALASASGSSDSQDQSELVAAMPDRETVCACNAVNKSQIMCAVLEDGLETCDQVRDRTKASSSCGGCKPMVAAIVKYALKHGKDAMLASAPPICGCTDLSHEQLKAAVAEGDFAHKEEAMLALGWRSKSGCDECGPSMEYYLSLWQPANPAAAAASGRGASPTGLSVGIVANDEHERKEGYDSQSLGTELYHVGESLTFPVPMRAVVTSGLHNPAGVLVHDIGITGAPAGWEVYAAGHAENPVKQGQLIGIAESDEEALELSAACLQLYRERADYGEPMWKWMEKEGIIEIREMLFDSGYRKELTGRIRVVEAAAASEERFGERICSKR
ncbi:nitrite reductase large subunit NirB [Paenibacillus sp. N4]|uniref:nitrite reductase large subunit NirB n=1 Tax=Paenibacillus vietnamensis TaxID=2590547 RepID=UPI001CD05613|nr:nitrite reductase large subunit NirB [Paenibacillus vietnamensis]MCA0754304.1 nitrite reductase large subunit NirB [Paenibacillus vietnamensis]